MAGFKKYFLGVAKVASIISLAVLIVLGAVWLFSVGLDKYHEKKEAPLAIMKKWKTIEASQLKSNLILQTKWESSGMAYRFFIQLNDSGSTLPEIDSINLIFQDKDGFKIFEEKIYHSEMVRNIGEGKEDGKILAYSVDKNTSYTSQKDYESAATWDIIYWKH